MVEFRPSTWALLGVMCLLIFAPLLFLDLDGVSVATDNVEEVHPSATIGRPSGNKPVANAPAGNTAPRDPAPNAAGDNSETN